LSKPSRTLTVEDQLSGRGEHHVERFWHFSERCDVSLQGHLVVVSSPVGTVRIELPADVAEIQLLRGNEERPAGWTSPTFDVKLPAFTVVERHQMRGDSVLTARITCP
jgi:hypothetical protein